MDAGNALTVALYTALNGAITGAVHDQVPTDATYPYTVIGEDTDTPDDLRDVGGQEVTTTLHTWSAAAGSKEVRTIRQEIDAVLHRAPLSLSGARCWYVAREFSQIIRDEDPDTGKPLRHGVTRYRFRVEPA